MSIKSGIRRRYIKQSRKGLIERFSVSSGDVITINDFPGTINSLITYLNRVKLISEKPPSAIQRDVINLLDKLLAATEPIRNVYSPPPVETRSHWKTLEKLLSLIDDSEILHSNVSHYMKAFLISCKHGKSLRVEDAVSNEKGILPVLTLSIDTTCICDLSVFPTIVDLINRKGNTLEIEGFFELPAPLKTNALKPVALVNGRELPMETVNRFNNRYILDRAYRQQHGFKLSIPLDRHQSEIRIGYHLGDSYYLARKITYSWLSPVGSDAPFQYLDLANSILVATSAMLCVQPLPIESNELIEQLRDVGARSVATDDRNYLENQVVRAFFKLFVNGYDERLAMQIEALFEMLDFAGCKTDIARIIYEHHATTNSKTGASIWLIIDRPHRADDNGEAFFRYMVATREEHPTIYPYFILDEDATNFDELNTLGTIIKPFSMEHRMLHVVADFVISSQMQEFVNNPFNTDFKYMRDLCRRPRFIFLQHGVIHNYHGPTLGKYGRNFAGFVTSSQSERDYILSPYLHYKESQVWLTGLPRFDRLYDKKDKIITIMPTWRQWLTERIFDEEQNTQVWKVKEDFTDSDYFQFFQGIINNERLLEAAHKFGYRIQVQLHVNFLPIASLFSHSAIVTVNKGEKSYRDIFAESALIVTDYSSAVFDFAYLRKPIIYAQFDKDAFYADHSVKRGYFDFERDGFGDIVNSIDECVNTIIRYVEEGCLLKDIYRHRIDSFFAYNDKRCCARLYKHILDEMKDLKHI